MKRIIYLSVVAALCAGGCDAHRHDEHEHENEHAHEVSAAHTDEIIFPAEQAARTDFAVATVGLQSFNETIACSGTLQEAQTGRSVVASPVAGKVLFAGDWLEGAAVRAGETLFHIDTKSFAGGDAAAKARARYEQARAEYERVAALNEAQVASLKEREAARTEYENAAAEYAPFMSGGDAGISVVSPQAGCITALAVRSGEYVEAGAELAVVSDRRRMRLAADVPQRYGDRLHGKLDASFTVAGGKNYRLSELNGTLVAVGKSAAAATIPVVFEFDNPDDLVSGAFVEVVLLGAPLRDKIVLPLEAITESQGLYYVYIQLDEEGYLRREVKLGGSDGRSVVVESGLQAGERVVTRGAVQVKMAAASGAIPHGHSHNH